MSHSLFKEEGKFFLTESGIITPTFFNNLLALPEDDTFITEEQVFAEALERVLYDTKYTENLMANRTALLQKYDLEKVALSYLNRNN